MVDGGIYVNVPTFDSVMYLTFLSDIHILYTVVLRYVRGYSCYVEELNASWLFAYYVWYDIFDFELVCFEFLGVHIGIGIGVHGTK